MYSHVCFDLKKKFYFYCQAHKNIGPLLININKSENIHARYLLTL